METRRDMPVWAPTHEQLKEIEQRVRMERTAAASDFFSLIRSIVREDA